MSEKPREVIADRSCAHTVEFGIVVCDLARSLRFYREVLGFELVGRASNDRCDTIALALGTSLVKLLRWREAPAKGTPGMTTTGYRYMTVHVRDVDVALDRCVAAGADVLIPASRHSGTVRFAFVADPDGNSVELSEGVPWLAITENELEDLLAG